MDVRKPRLRLDLDFIPVDHEGQRLLAVHDSLGLVPPGTGIPLELGRILALLDGSRGPDQLRLDLAPHTGGELPTEAQLAGLLAELDRAFLLDSPTLEAARQRLRAEFAAPVRPAVLAGRSYPAEPDVLAHTIDTMVAAVAAQPLEGMLTALVAPHIDLAAGGRVYASAYGHLSTSGLTPRRVIVLGVGHRLGDGLFSLLDKDWATPLGQVRADREAVARLQASLPRPGDPFAHRDEHSIELQLVFLQRLLGDISLVPVLCGSTALLPEYGRRGFQQAAGAFLETLAQLAAEPQTLVVAGVDFCHIGHKFGQEQTGRDLAQAATDHDQRLLAALAAADADAFWAESARVEDRYNVCGLTALATLLEILPPGCRGQVLDHDLWHEAPTQSAVSFAALAYSR